MRYLASDNPTHERRHDGPGLALRTPATCTAQHPSNLYLVCALLAALLCAPAPNALAQSGRRKQTTINPSSTQRPRRATTGASQDKTPASNNGSATSAPKTSQPVSILPDDAPPPPRPKPTPNATVSNEPDEEVGPEDVVRITSSLVTVPASVIDAYGRAVMGLKLEDFELRVDGQVKSINDVTYSDTPVRLALLFDNSSSLTRAREFEKQAAIRFFRTVLRPVDQAAIYNVYTEVELVQPLTGDVRALVRTIENFGKPEGATRLFDAIVQAANYLRPQAGRKVIVIVSDGEDTLSDTDFEETVRIAQASDCQIYVVQTKQIEYVMQTGQPLGNANLRSLAAERRLQEFAAQTGGAVYAPLAINELDAAFAQISADLAQQYVLSYYPADDRQDGRFRAISLRIISHPAARVRARKGYYASKAGMKAGLNQQINPSRDANASITSDSVPREKGVDTSISSSIASVSSASEVRVISSVQPVTLPPAQSQKVVSESPPPQTISQPAAQPAQPSSGAQSSQSQPRQTSQTSETSPEPPVPSPTQVSGGVMNGRALNLPKPDYPATARLAGASGMVVVEVTVDETGKVVAARAVSGNAMLRAAAVSAARLARFAPTKLSGQPVKVRGIINYNFVAR